MVEGKDLAIGDRQAIEGGQHRGALERIRRWIRGSQGAPSRSISLMRPRLRSRSRQRFARMVFSQALNRRSSRSRGRFCQAETKASWVASRASASFLTIVRASLSRPGIPSATRRPNASASPRAARVMRTSSATDAASRVPRVRSKAHIVGSS